MTLGEKLTQLRTDRGLSQTELAEKLEVSRQSVSKWETAQATPDLDKIIKLADLFGVTVDELVREGERPQPPEPEAKVVYVERKPHATPTQVVGIVLLALGAVLVALGLYDGLCLIFGALCIALALPLVLAQKHPWLICGWLAVALSLLFLNPYTSISPWGLIGGVKCLYYFAAVPELRYPSYLIAAAVGMVRGTVILVLLWFTWRAYKKRKREG